MCALLVLGVKAQVGASSVGAMTYQASPNQLIAVGVPLLRPVVAAGTVSAASASSLTLVLPWGENGALGQRFKAGEAYYVEVVGQADGSASTMVGQRFEINETASAGAATGVVVLDVASALNTSAASALPSLVGARVVIRSHWTLKSIFGSGAGTALNASETVAKADQVYLWNGSGFSVYYLRKGSTPEWRSVTGGSTNQDGVIVPPGVGLYFRRQEGAASFSVVGEVRSTPFVRSPLGKGQLVASAFPLPASPADLQLVSDPNLTAGTVATGSDQLLTVDGPNFNVFFLRAGAAAAAWRDASTGALDSTTSKLVPAGGAALFRLIKPLPTTVTQVVPYTP